MTGMTSKQAGQRYLVEFTIVTAFYIAAVFGIPLLIKATGAQGPLLYALALLPAMPIAGWFVVMGRYLINVDEYMRARTVRALLLAAAMVVSVVTAWDFLRVYAGAPPIPPFFIGPGFFAAMGIAAPLCRLFEPPAQGEPA